MSDYKIRVKHLTEDNTIESLTGEMIISQVTGHISVKDQYFINSATKDIAARNNALNNFYDYIKSDIDFLSQEVINFNKSVKRLNKVIADSADSINELVNEYDKVLSDIETQYNDEVKDLDIINIENDIEYKTPIDKVINIVENQYNAIKILMDDNLIEFIKDFNEIERILKEEIDLVYRELKYIEPYISNQKYIYHENRNELNDEFKINEENYQSIYLEYANFMKEMKEKYIELQKEFPDAEIEFKINFEEEE